MPSRKLLGRHPSIEQTVQLVGRVPTDLLADKKRRRHAVAVGKGDIFVQETISVLVLA